MFAATAVQVAAKKAKTTANNHESAENSPLPPAFSNALSRRGHSNFVSSKTYKQRPQIGKKAVPPPVPVHDGAGAENAKNGGGKVIK
ncbi:hypothetical protein HK102_010196, partial [Quaeritorhiza haematococci]